MITLYVVGSHCQMSGAGGWGCAAALPHGAQEEGGPLHQSFTGATLVELAAVQRAFSWLAPRIGRDQAVEIAVRSTATIAVLRWVFPDASYEGQAEVLPPKSLKKDTREFPPLYELAEDVEAKGAQIHLRHAQPSTFITAAQALAYSGMLIARSEKRRSA